MKILVTGGAGFIGLNLCQRLVREGHHVISLDNFYCSSKERALECAFENLQVIEHDVREPIPNDIIPDQIYHLACPASPRHYQKDEIYTHEVCFLGTRNVILHALEHGSRLLNCSTSEVYGDPDVNPQPESYWGNVNPCGVRSCYDEGKRISESMCASYEKQRGLDVRTARIFNTYGVGMNPDDGRVVSNFITQALIGNPVTIHGDGSQTRSFCYVDDTVDALIRLMNSNVLGAVNIGNPNEISMLELYSRLQKIFHLEYRGDIRKVHDELPLDDPKIRQPDITRAIDELGWEPTTLLDVGLSKTIEYFHLLMAE